MKTTCPACGARQSLLRVLTFWSGLHARCRACGDVYRLVETPGAVFTVLGVFGLCYVLAFWALSFVEPPAGWSPWVLLLAFAALPAMPGAAAAVLVTGWLHRLGPPDYDRVPRMSGWTFALVYLAATLAMAVLVATFATGILLLRFAEELPRPAFPAEPPAAVGLADGEAEAFAFVDLVSEPRSLAGLRGAVVFVHLFDPDTRGARQVLASIRELRKEVQDDGVLFAVVAECSRDLLAMFVDRGAPGLPYAYLDGELPQLVRDFGAARPLTFVLDQAGQVVFRHSGLANWDTEEAERFLTDLARGR
jgi:uncharacterized protein (DUF983 family)